MKKTALLMIAVVGVGSVLVPGGAGAVDLFNTNIVGEVNTGNFDAWVISDTTAADYVITNSTISAVPGSNMVWNLAPVSGTIFASLGRGGLMSSWTALHNVAVTDSTITGGDGGDMTVVSNTVAGTRKFVADGGDGMFLKNVKGVFNEADIFGGNGGDIFAPGAYFTSSAEGGFGLTLQGNSTLYATNSTFTGGNGGTLSNATYSGSVVGGAGIIVTNDSGTATVVLDLSNTTVTGGDGGKVEVDYMSKERANGGSALLVGTKAGAMVNLTIKGGTFIGGEAGTVGTNTMQAGKSINVVGAGANLTLEDGSFTNGILFSAGTSTLALKSPVKDGLLEFAGTSLKVTEWSAGHLSDVKVSAGTMSLDGTGPFNLSGKFIVDASGTGKANFNSGLVVDSTGRLELGLAESTASNVHTKAGSTIISSYNGTKTGTLKSWGSLTLDAGTKWEIAGTKNISLGEVFTLATASNTNIIIANNLNIADVSYRGAGQAGWLGKIIDVYTTTNNQVQAKYGLGDIDEMLGLKGDVSPLGKAVADLSLLVKNSSSKTNTLLYLANLTPTSSAAGSVITNGLLHTTQSAKSVVANQKVYVGVINNRTHSYLNHEGVGYPVAGPSGAAGWDLLRNFSDRVESKVSTDGLRSFSDRVEGRYGYDDVASSMRHAEEGEPLAGVRLPESWQIWGEGFGSTAHQDTIDGVAGYDVGTGGAMLGIDKRFNNMMIGIAGGFSQSSVDGYQANDARIDTLNLIGYLSAYIENAYIDLNVNYAMNNVDTEFKPYQYTGNYDANALGFYVGGGYGIALNDWLMLTPEASFMGTYYSRDSYNEKSSLMPTKQYESYDQFSSVGTVGATLTMIRKIDLSSHEVFIQPEVRAHLVHDFNTDMDPETYRFQGGTSDIETPMIETEDNLFKIGAGIRLSEWNNSSTEVGLDVDGLFADGYNAYMISGKIMHRF